MLGRCSASRAVALPLKRLSGASRESAQLKDSILTNTQADASCVCGLVKDLIDSAEQLLFARGLAVYEPVALTAGLERHVHALSRVCASIERKQRHVKNSLKKQMPTHSAV